MANRRVAVEFGGDLVTLYEDGSIQRRHRIPVPSSHGTFLHDVTSTDVTLDDATGVWARIFVPKDDAEDVRVLVFFLVIPFCMEGISTFHSCWLTSDLCISSSDD